MGGALPQAAAAYPAAPPAPPPPPATTIRAGAPLLPTAPGAAAAAASLDALLPPLPAVAYRDIAAVAFDRGATATALATAAASASATGGGARTTTRIHGALRPLHIPAELVRTFELLAEPNTRAGERGIETCAVLAGRIHDDAGVLAVTHLVLPPQAGAADSCEVTDDAALLEYCTVRGLLTLGWVHTHPSQACFLSSMDLHTHAGYQAGLPEAVAVVVAPTDPACATAVFRLTDGGGLQLIQACEVRAQWEAGVGCCWSAGPLGTRLKPHFLPRLCYPQPASAAPRLPPARRAVPRVRKVLPRGVDDRHGRWWRRWRLR